MQKHLAVRAAGTLLGTRKVLELQVKLIEMGRKVKDAKALLRHNLIVRLPDELYQKLENIQRDSNCRSLADAARKLIGDKTIKYFYRDAALDGPMEEMALIRKELRAIGININQLTRSFNTEKSSESARAYYVLKVADLYQKVDIKVERLLALIGKMADKWLQG